MKLNHSSKCVLEICTKGRCYSQVIISLWILLEKNLYLLSGATKWQKIISMIKNPSTVHINIPPTLKSTQPYSLDPKRSSIASLYLKAIEYNTYICTFCIYSTPACFHSRHNHMWDFILKSSPYWLSRKIQDKRQNFLWIKTSPFPQQVS